MSYTLKKTDDPNFIKKSDDTKWIQWLHGKGDSLQSEIAIGRSLIMSPFSHLHTWLTSPVTQIISNTPTQIHFKTKNSSYILTKN